MKNLVLNLSSWLFPGVLSAIALLPCAVSAQSTAVSATNEPPRSVFEVRREYNDPFFPKRVPVAAATKATNAPAVPPDCFREIILKGISGSSGKRLALINNQTLAEGESAAIRTTQGIVKVECREIKEASVVIKADCASEPKELFLRRSF